MRGSINIAKFAFQTLQLYRLTAKIKILKRQGELLEKSA